MMCKVEIAVYLLVAVFLKMCGLAAGSRRIGPAIILQGEHFLSKVSVYLYILRVCRFYGYPKEQLDVSGSAARQSLSVIEERERYMI